jgi:hypothetical protein
MKHLLIEARQEILDLRRRNEILSAQMGVVEVFAAALGLKRSEGGASPDVAWALQNKIAELSATKPDATAIRSLQTELDDRSQICKSYIDSLTAAQVRLADATAHAKWLEDAHSFEHQRAERAESALAKCKAGE